MRFVQPETVRIDLAPQDGKARWIEVKKELTKGEDAAYRTRGFRSMSHNTGGDSEIAIDWTAMALARVEAYLVDWSAKDAKDKPVKVTKEAIGNLDDDSFTEIDTAIQTHIAEMADAKKARSGNQVLTAT